MGVVMRKHISTSVKSSQKFESTYSFVNAQKYQLNVHVSKKRFPEEKLYIPQEIAGLELLKSGRAHV